MAELLETVQCLVAFTSKRTQVHSDIQRPSRRGGYVGRARREEMGRRLLRNPIAALEQCRRTGVELLVAKLDRLSRKVSFIAQLMDDPKVRLRVATMPQADKFQLHIYAALAEQERDFISARTKAALKAAKARGTKLGGLRDTTMRRNAAIQQKAASEAQKLLQTIGPMRDAGQTLEAIAAALDRLGVATSRGGKWTPKQISRVLARRGVEHAS